MKKVLKSLSILAMTLVLFLASFSNFASAKGKNNEDIYNKEVEELAYMLEFIFETAVIKDELGNVIDLDIDMIEEEFGTNPEIEQLKEQRETFIKLNEQKEIIKKECQNQLNLNSYGVVSPYYVYDPVDICVSKKIQDQYGSIVTGAFLSAIIAELWDQNWKKAAELAIKAGIKGSAFGIASSLTQIFFTCLWEYGDDPWK